jgi:undecaprenol kinase
MKDKTEHNLNASEHQSVSAPSSIPALLRIRWRQTANVTESFYHAFRGLFLALKEERNLQIHCAVAICSLCAGLLFNIDAVSWILLTISIGLVIAAELLNTALEILVDITVEGKFSVLARNAKDIAAAAVLCMVVVAITTGLIIFVPRALALLKVHFA